MFKCIRTSAMDSCMLFAGKNVNGEQICAKSINKVKWKNSYFYVLFSLSRSQILFRTFIDRLSRCSCGVEGFRFGGLSTSSLLFGLIESWPPAHTGAPSLWL